jgi:hypothetical protein
VVKKLPIAEYSVVKKSLSYFDVTIETAISKPKRVALRTFKPDLRLAKAGGEYRDRTGDLLVANQALSQLS